MSIFRIALPDPRGDGARFVVAGQSGVGSGDVKLFQWHRKVRPHQCESPEIILTRCR